MAAAAVDWVVPWVAVPRKAAKGVAEGWAAAAKAAADLGVAEGWAVVGAVGLEVEGRVDWERVAAARALEGAVADLVDLEVVVGLVAWVVAAAVAVGRVRRVEVAKEVVVVWEAHADCCHSPPPR